MPDSNRGTGGGSGGGGSGTASVWKDIWLYANQFVPDITVFPTAGTYQTETNKFDHMDFFEYPDGALGKSYTIHGVPSDMDLTEPVNIQFYARTPSTTTGNIGRLSLAIVGVAHDESPNIGASSGQTPYIQPTAAANDLLISTVVSYDLSSVLARDDLMVIQAKRLTTGDTMTNVLRMVMWRIQYKVQAATEIT